MLGRPIGQLGPFGMEDVVLDAIGLDRAKSADADVEGCVHPIDASAGEPFEERRGEVQPRRGGGDRAGGRREGRLIARPVTGLFPTLSDVRGQRHRPVRIQERRGLAPPFRPHDPAASLPAPSQDQSQSTTDHHALASRRPPARLGEDFPGAVRQGPQEKPFPGPPRRFSHPHQPRRDDARIVADQGVAGFEEFGQVGEASMFPHPAIAPDHQQTGAVARLDRVLGDQLGGQLKIKFGSLHAEPLRPLAPSSRR